MMHLWANRKETAILSLFSFARYFLVIYSSWRNVCNKFAQNRTTGLIF